MHKLNIMQRHHNSAEAAEVRAHIIKAKAIVFFARRH